MSTKLKVFFSNLTLSQRFMLASFMILLAGMLGIGAWVEKQVETGVIHRTGATTALYVDSFVAPQLQELGQSSQLSPNQVKNLSRLLQNSPMGQQIVAFKVWDTRGRVIYSSDPATIGKTYPMHEGLLRARLGEVVSEISTLDEDENESLGALHSQLLETYSPVWLSGTNQVIAVAEFYQMTSELDREIGILQRQSWLVVGLAILVVYLLLSIFVRRASDTITSQQAELGQKVVQLTGLLAQNQELHERVRRAAASVTQLNESYLRRIGAELHDGPAQDLGLALLKLDAAIAQMEDDADQWAKLNVSRLEGQAPGAQAQTEQAPTVRTQAIIEQLNTIQTSLQSALKEVRGIASGLSLPQLAELSLSETVVRAVRAHERRTGTKVALHLEPTAEPPLPVKITTYRLLQEALNNAFRHASGAGQQVHVRQDGGQLLVEISDEGPGFDPKAAALKEGHLGISGMRERVESLGGRFSLESDIGAGTRLRARLPLQLQAEQA